MPTMVGDRPFWEWWAESTAKAPAKRNSQNFGKIGDRTIRFIGDLTAEERAAYAEWRRKTGSFDLSAFLAQYKPTAGEAKPAAPGSPAPAPDGGTGPGPVDGGINPNTVLEMIKGMFPWVADLGLAGDILNWVQEGLTSPDAIVAKIRGSQQWKSRFVGIRRQNGELRMNEAQYLQRETEYRQLLRNFGRANSEYDDPNDFRAFFENEVDPNELGQRFKVYEEIRRGSDDVKDAFYVYAGMRLSDDDLYLAAVNPERNKALLDEYNQRVARSPLDFDTWITRATEAGLDRVQRRLGELQEQGVATGDVVDRVRQVNPDFARQMMAALYSNGTERFLGLEELERSFEYAMIGSAAKLNGFQLPDAKRIEAFRQAGINRARALETYGTIRSQGNTLVGGLQRANLRQQFTQEDFEDALFLNTAEERDLLERAQRYDESLARGAGSFGFQRDRSSGTLQQKGLQYL